MIYSLPMKIFYSYLFCTQNHTSPRQKKWLHLVLLASSLAGKCSRWYTILHIILHIIIYYLPFLQLFMCYIFCFQCHLHFTIVFCHINKNFIQIFRWIYSCLSKTSGGWNLKWQHKSIEICQRCVNEDCSCLEEPSAMGPSSGQPPLWFKDLEPSKTSNVTKSNRTECPEDVSKTSEGGESEVRRDEGSHVCHQEKYLFFLWIVKVYLHLYPSLELQPWCVRWDYDRSDWPETVVSQFHLVCERWEKVSYISWYYQFTICLHY